MGLLYDWMLSRNIGKLYIPGLIIASFSTITAINNEGPNERWLAYPSTCMTLN